MLHFSSAFQYHISNEHIMQSLSLTKPSPRQHADSYQLKYQSHSAVNSSCKASSTASFLSLATFSLQLSASFPTQTLPEQSLHSFP